MRYRGKRVQERKRRRSRRNREMRKLESWLLGGGVIHNERLYGKLWKLGRDREEKKRKRKG